MYQGKNTGNGSLNLSVLVLNKFYTVVRIVSTRRAFVLLYKKTAEVITKYNGTYLTYDFEKWLELSEETFGRNGNEFIHTVTKPVMVPQVIRLVNYDKLPKHQEKVNRRGILSRDEHRCQYCGKQYPTTKLSIDHIIPRSKRGSSNWENLVACCSRCNTKKGGRLPQEAGMKLIRKPTAPKMNPIFYTRLNDQKYALWKEFITTG